MAAISIAKEGNAQAVELISNGKWLAARRILKNILDKQAPDQYNYGLTFEGGAETVEDYEEAKRIYVAALQQDPTNSTIAQGVGRMERRIKEAKKISAQRVN